eukprot:3279822-Rhodomonas_salina.1
MERVTVQGWALTRVPGYPGSAPGGPGHWQAAAVTSDVLESTTIKTTTSNSKKQKRPCTRVLKFKFAGAFEPELAQWMRIHVYN